MQATGSVIYFPKQPKSSRKAKQKKPVEKCTALEWIRSGYQFPGKKPPASCLPPSNPNPLPPIQVPPRPDNPPRKPGEKGGAQ